MAAPTTAEKLLVPQRGGSLLLTVRRRFSPGAWLPFLLLTLSVATTASSGARFMRNFRLGQPPLVSDNDLVPLAWIWRHPTALASGWSFSVALLTILLAHEGGHLFFCRRHGIQASWPYVLPAPTLSGTAGAVIRIRSRIPSRRALIEVGIGGPIAGYLVAVPIMILGILLSKPAVPGSVPALIQFHQPLTIILLHRVLEDLLPGLPSMQTSLPHPILLAGWVGCFITSLNLLPAGQLDGGHILYAISPQWHRRMTFALPVLLLAMGIGLWTGWLLWGVILLLPVMRHPQVSYIPRLPERHRWLGVIALVLLALTLLPSPFAGTGLLDLLR